MKLKLFTIHCQKCNVIKLKLDKLQLPYEIEDDEDTVVKVAEEHDITTGAPILQVDDNFYDFSGALKFIKEQESK